MLGYGYPIEVLHPGSSYTRGEVRYEGRETKRDAAIARAREELLATTPLEEVTDAIDLAPTPRSRRRTRSAGRKTIAKKSTAAKATRTRGRRSPTTR